MHAVTARPRFARFRSLALSVLLVCLASVVTLVTDGSTRAGAQGSGDWTPEWNLSFQDDFDGYRVDSSSWNIYDSPGHASNGLGSPSAMSVGDGMLTITARNENGQVVSGGMNTLPSWTYG